MGEVPPDQRPCVVTLGGDDLDRFARRVGLPAYGPDGRGGALLRIARTLARSPTALDLDVTFIVRGGATPALGVLGPLTHEQRVRIDVLTATLPRRLAELRYLGWSDVEAATQQLAQRLEDRLRPSGLDQARFVAIPRGGHIVLGMLAMVLGLRAEQLAPTTAAADGALHIVVDDCVLTGHRFATWLRTHEQPRVALATLCAPEGAPEAILAAEPERVVAVEAAVELRDLGPDHHGDAYAAWRRGWRDRLGDQRYWMGDAEPVAFAWKEPDAPLWNTVTGRREPGWRVLPGEVCLGNRAPVGGPTDAQARVPAVVLQEEGPGPLRAAATVLHGQHDGVTSLIDTDTGTVTNLNGVAGAMWGAVVAGGSIDAAITDLLARYDVDGAQLRADLTAFVEAMLRRGLLVTDRHGSA